MKAVGLAMLVAACACLVMSAPAGAAENAPLPGSIVQTSMVYGSSLEDEEAPVADGACGVCDACCAGRCVDGCNACSSRGCGGLFGSVCCCEEEPLRLLPCGLPSLGLDIYGWVSGGGTINDDNSASNFNGVLLFNDRNEVQVNQMYLVFERAVETGCCSGFDIGGRVDLLYGTDARFVEVDGLLADANREPFYGIAMPQMYAEVAYNNLSVKLGHFYSIVGYESVMAPENFFYSHSYATVYGEPFTHTGMLANWDATDRLSLTFGFDRGWDRFNPNPDGDQLTYFGGLNWTNKATGTSVTLSLTGGQETANPFIPFVKGNRWFYSLVLEQQLTERLTYVLHHDCGNQDMGSPFTGLDAEWYGISQYAFYELNCKWDVGARFEWFRDDDGLRVGGWGRRNGGSPIVPFGFAGDFYELTVGANWKPNANVSVRPEVRFDWYEGYSGFGPRPFDDGLDDGMVTFAVDVVCSF